MPLLHRIAGDRHFGRAGHLVLFLLIIVAASACQTAEDGATNSGPITLANDESSSGLVPLALPTLTPLQRPPDRPLQVVATTSIIGDVVAHVGGDATSLTTLMAAGQDPHSYEPSTGDLTKVAESDLIFVNGWQLEEALLDDLTNIAVEAPIVPISANITPLLPAGEAHEHGAVDPHVWLDPQLVTQWVHNVQDVLSDLDPANAPVYAANAAAYLKELAALDDDMVQQLSQIPPASRKLVTNHDSLTYFAHRFDFEIVGAVIPAPSTVAEPSAQQLAALVQKMREENVCTIFAETTASPRLAETVAAELTTCDTVDVLLLHTGALGPPGSGASSYTEMMRTNTDTIVRGLETGD